MDTIVRKVNDFYKTKYAVIIFSIIGTFFGVIEIVMFFTGALEINGTSFGDETSQAQLWTTLFAFGLSLFSLYFGFYIGIANTNKSPYASYYSAIGTAVAMIMDVLAGLWLISIELLITIPIIMYRKNFWNKERYKEEKFQFKNMWPWVLLTAIIGMIIFYGMVFLWHDQIYGYSILPWMEAPNADPKFAWKWYFDASVAWMGILGSFCFVFRWRQAYFWWTVCKVPQTILFITAGLYVQATQQVIWLLIDMGTVLALTHQISLHKKEKEGEEKGIQ